MKNLSTGPLMTSFFITCIALSDHFLGLRIPAECTGNDGP